MLLNQQYQADVDPITPMPTDRTDDTSVVNTSSAEAVVWYKLSSGAWAAAATSAAGTVCMAKLTYDGVLNSIGSAIGTYNDTSLTWGAATRVSTLVRVPDEVFSKMQSMSETDQIATITPYLSTNGDYVIDHRRGQVWMKSKATVANDAATYLYKTPLTGGGTGDKVDIIKVAGNTMAADDAAFTPGTSGVMTIAGYADETTPDSVNEGDTGALRMLLNRVLLVQPSDGTNHAGFNSTWAETIALAGNSMNTAAGMYGVDADAGTPIMRAFQVAVDNATVSATPNVGIIGGIYKNADDTYDDNDAVPFHFTSSGELRTAGGSSVTAQYRATTTGRGDGTATYASGTTLTIAGTPFTLADEDLVYIREVDATANTSTLWVNGQSGVQFEISSGTLTKTGGTNFSANGVYELGYNGQDKGYDVSNTAIRNEIINRDTDKDVADTLLDLTNISQSTTAYGYVDMENFKYVIFQNETSGTAPTDTLTLTLEGTCQSDAAAASCTYQDVTSALTGAASYVDTDCMWIIDNAMKFKYLRIKYVTNAGGGNDADLTTYVIKGC